MRREVSQKFEKSTQFENLWKKIMFRSAGRLKNINLETAIKRVRSTRNNTVYEITLILYFFSQVQVNEARNL